MRVKNQNMRLRKQKTQHRRKNEGLSRVLTKENLSLKSKYSKVKRGTESFIKDVCKKKEQKDRQGGRKERRKERKEEGAKYRRRIYLTKLKGYS